MGNNTTNLPPGFRFCPTDEELVVHFLQRESSASSHPDIIPDLHLYPYDPWELDGKAMVEGRKWYYYSRKSQNRMTENGYWKAWDNGEEGIISSNGDHKIIGVKKYYVFHIGEAPQGTKTNWIMEEFRVVDSNGASTSGGGSKRTHRLRTDCSKRVICRVYEHNYDNNENYIDDNEEGVELSCQDEFYLSIEDFDDASFPI